MFYAKYALDFTGISNSGGVIPQLTVPRFKNTKIPVPPLKIQKKLVAEIKKLEDKINQAQEVVDQAPKKKNQILEKYL